MKKAATVLTELRQSTATAVAAIDHALDRLALAQARQPQREAQARARAQAEFADIDPETFGDLASRGQRHV